jgi:hypothetical protein
MNSTKENKLFDLFQKLTAAGKKMLPTEVAKIIVENLPQHEMIEKVCYHLKVIKIKNFVYFIFLRSIIQDRVLSMSLFQLPSFPNKFEIFFLKVFNHPTF